MTDDNAPTADGESIPDSVDDDVPGEMTEQIEASFGPMSVYVSGTDTESVRETFADVWETMMDTSEKMKEMKEDAADEGNKPGPSFGD